MNDAQATIFSGIVGAILVGIIGVVGTYLGAVKIAKKNKRIEAGFNLYDSFRHTLRSLERAENFDTQDILNRSFGEQMKAAEHFRFFLTGRTLKGFSEAWDEYKEKNSKQKYADQGVKAEREPHREAALAAIYKILKFTDYEKRNPT